jgi:PAS domain S-box-containing protein
MNASPSLLELHGFDARKVGDLWLARLAQEAVFGSIEHGERLTTAMHACLLEALLQVSSDDSDVRSRPIPVDLPRIPTASALHAIELLAGVMLEAAAANGVEPEMSELHQLAERVAQRISEHLVEHANPHEQSAHEWVQAQMLRLTFEREQLAQRSALLTATLEQLPAGVAIADASGRILLASKEFQRALGEAEMRLEHVQDYDGLYLYSGAGSSGRRRRPGPLARALGKGRAVRHELLEIQRPQNGRTVIDLSAAPVTGHHINAAVALVEDVTERQKQSHALKQSWQLSSDLLCVVGLDAYLKQINPAFVRTMGYAEEELLRTPLWDFVYPDDRNNVLLEMRRLAQGIPMVKSESRYRCKDGAYKWLSWSAVPVLDEHVSYAVVREVSSSHLRDLNAVSALPQSESSCTGVRFSAPGWTLTGPGPPAHAARATSRITAVRNRCVIVLSCGLNRPRCRSRPARGGARRRAG